MNIPFAYSNDELKEAGGLGKTQVHELINEGRLRARKLGRKTIILATDLHACLESLPAIEPKPAVKTGGRMIHGPDKGEPGRTYGRADRAFGCVILGG